MIPARVTPTCEAAKGLQSMGSNPSEFRARNFITLSLALCFTVVGVSGVALFLRPEGSLARWVGWSVLGLDKGQWEAVHIASVAVFLVISPVHLWYNWRPLTGYLRARILSGSKLVLRPELAAAAALVALVVLGSLKGWQPFHAVNQLRASIKDGGTVVTTAPPAANADRLTVQDLCARIDLQPRDAIANARERGIEIDPSKTLAGIAEDLGVSPEAVYQAIVGGGQAARP